MEEEADVRQQHRDATRRVWRCELAKKEDSAVLMPFECGGTIVTAAFYSNAPNCDHISLTVAGYLLDENEAGGEGPAWRLQVDAPLGTFPGFLTWVGAAFVALGLTFPRLLAWSAVPTARR